jgi:hypothetical protein
LSEINDYQDLLSTEDSILGAFENNVVIAAAMNYGVEQIKNFVLSFRRYNQLDDIILIYNLEQTHRIEKFAKKHNIKLVSFDPCDKIPMHVVSSRFLKYLDIVVEHSSYKNYLLADIRDVFFQSNPFVNLPNKDYLYMFTEDPAVTLDIEEHHIKMFNKLFGPEEIQKFKDKKIICSGTILGTRNEMLKFLDVFAKYLNEIRNKNPNICFEMLLDQVIANHICYLQDFGCELSIKDNGDIVGTIGHCITHPNHSGDMKLDGDIIYLDGKVPSIIHQYDRSPELFNHFSRVYSHVN